MTEKDKEDEIKKNDDKEKIKHYYETNKERIKKMVSEKRRILNNSDIYIERNRENLLNLLNNGSRRWISEKNKIKYSIHQDEKTLKYVYLPK